MAGGSFFVLLDDIAAILDDVAAMTKIAAKKTAGVVGDDLAVNAQQVTGVTADRELPIVWQVAKGSLWNKVKIIPLALLLSAISKILVTVALMLGGIYLCYEGAEKIFGHEKDGDDKSSLSEKEKIDGAIKTDFVLSGEIMVIALGAASNLPFLSQILVLSVIGIVMTIGVYGLVGVIVKADDVGVFLLETNKDNFNSKFSNTFSFITKKDPFKIILAINKIIFRFWSLLFQNKFGLLFLNYIGKQLVFLMPKFMRLLTIVGTIAMFMVGGGIFTHNLHDLEFMKIILSYFIFDGLLGQFMILVLDILIGLIIGLCALLFFGKLLEPFLKTTNKRE